MSTQTSVAEFFNAWSPYEKALQENILRHREMYEAIKPHLPTTPFSILDVGCGDASYLASTLKEAQVTRYVGYDVSEVALKGAASNIAVTGCDTVTQAIDYMEGLEKTKERYDLLFCGYTLHHIVGEKQRFFDLARKVLKPRGKLIVIDIVASEGEDVRSCVHRLLEHIKPRYSADEYMVVEQHITSSDFPGTYSAYMEYARKSGFTVSNHAAREDNLFSAMVWE